MNEDISYRPVKSIKNQSIKFQSLFSFSFPLLLLRCPLGFRCGDVYSVNPFSSLCFPILPVLQVAQSAHQGLFIHRLDVQNVYLAPMSEEVESNIHPPNITSAY